MPTRMFAAVMAVFLCSSPALSLGFPIPQPKPPCGTGDYWDGPQVHKNVASWPEVVRYIATTDYVLARLKDQKFQYGNQVISLPVVHEHTYDQNGCYVLNVFVGASANPWLDLLTDQEDS
jgi:hypothetical protein